LVGGVLSKWYGKKKVARLVAGRKNMTPTARTLRFYRDQGFLIDVVERWLPRIGVRRDLFNCIDALAIMPDEPILAIQSTVATCVSARLAKARATAALKIWLSTGARFVVIGWGLRDGRWLPRIEEVTLDQLGELSIETVATQAPA
jgi:hypothetical protein